MSLFGFIKRPPKSTAAPYRELPAYVPSVYDKPGSEQLYGTYSSRARGEGVGFEEADLRQMRAQEIDQAARGGNEVYARSMAGRRGTGGTTTGGTNRLRDRLLLSTQVAKSQALRDIGIRNAVLKREETWQGIQGLDNFVQNERGEAWRKTNYDAMRTQDYNTYQQYAEGITNQNRANNYAAWAGAFDSAQQLGSQAAMMAATGGAAGAAGAAGGVNYAQLYGQIPSQYTYGMPNYYQAPGVQNYRVR